MGAKKKTKGKVGRRQSRQAPLGHRHSRASRQPRGQAPPRAPLFKGKASAAWVQPRGCKGRSPLHKNNLKSPPSPPGKGGGGIGDRGQQSKLKAESAGVPRRFSNVFLFAPQKKSLQFPEECAIINALQAQPAQEAPQAGKQKERRNPHETVCCSQGRAD